MKQFTRRSAGKSVQGGVLAITLVVAAPAAFAGSSEELARKAADPTASLMSLNLRHTRIPSFHELDGSAGSSQFQAVIPFRAWNTSNILRTTVNYANSGPASDGLSDVTIFNLLVFDRPWGRWGAGPVAQLLPGRDGDSDTFAIGPAVGLVASSGPWTYGLFNQNLFGDGIGISSLQPVMASAGFEEVRDIVMGRCSMCHAAEPYYGPFQWPPKGVRLDTDVEIARHARQIYLRRG